MNIQNIILQRTKNTTTEIVQSHTMNRRTNTTWNGHQKDEGKEGDPLPIGEKE